MMTANVIATSGRAIEAAGDVDVLLLDKTGTITYGNRQASMFYPIDGISSQDLAEASMISSLVDETPEGKSIVALAKNKYNIPSSEVNESNAEFIPFTAQTRMSGVNYQDIEIRKGAVDAIQKWIASNGQNYPAQTQEIVNMVASRGSTPLVVARNHIVLGVIELKDVVKEGIKERFMELREMGIKTVMITGDNRLTAAAIAAEAGVDDFLAEATPENPRIPAKRAFSGNDW
jgi:K+-transporting ATPase ATPase B chain